MRRKAIASWGHVELGSAGATHQLTHRSSQLAEKASRAGNPDRAPATGTSRGRGAPPSGGRPTCPSGWQVSLMAFGSKARERDAPGGRQEALPSRRQSASEAGSGTVLASGRSVAEALQEATRAALRAKE